MSNLTVLFVHQNFPGQFPHIADALVARGDRVFAIGGPTSKERQGVSLIRWNNQRGSTPGIFDSATRAEADLIRAQCAASAAVALRSNGVEPDVIIGHPGWGETIHLKDVFPKAKQILFGEFYYRSIGGDVNFDPELEQLSLNGMMRTNGKNATGALAYTMADLIVSPTQFQASTFPEVFQSRIEILHEGVDLASAKPRPDVTLRLPNGVVLDRSIPVITFINRNFEPLRGFHIFMRALPAFLREVPDAHVIAIGGDRAGYGTRAPEGKTWREQMMGEVETYIDKSRLHFIGQVSHQQMIDILSIGAAHVYYTYPFVLSWSLIEAMACECLVIGSDTAPVRDAISDSVNGVLNDFFDVEALSTMMARAVREPETFRDLRTAARRTALHHFDRQTVGVPGWLKLVDGLVAGNEAVMAARA